ncbi:MAG: hypothetical protein GX038_03420 [Erysipelothrix sp.]|nr:hypothetical protein [Erysipelothrix sp.]
MKNTITVQFTNSEMEVIKQCAQSEGIEVSEFILNTVLESIDEEMDNKILEERMNQMDKDNEFLELNQVMLDLGLFE